MKKKKTTSSLHWPSKLREKNFVFVGLPTELSKQDLKARIEICGGVVEANLKASTNYLIVGETRSAGPSGAEKKAVKLNANQGANIQIIGITDLLKLLTPTGEEALEILKSPDGLELWEKIRWWSESFSANLSHAKLRGLKLCGVNLRYVELDGADLRETNLSKSYLPILRNGTLDNANLQESCPQGAFNAQFRKVDMTGGEFYHRGLFEQSDFSGATLKKVKTIGAKFKDCSFQNADFTEAELRAVDVSGCNFTAAKLNDAMFSGSNFSQTILHRAKLNRGDFSKVNFRGADLTKADLRNANLADADLTDAVIDGANFSGATLSGAKLGTLNPDKAKGLNVDKWKTSSILGPQAKKMLQVATKAGRIFTSAEVRVKGDRVELQFDCYGVNWATFSSQHFMENGSTRNYYNSTYSNQSVQSIWLSEVNRFKGGTLVLDTIKYKSSNSPIKGSALRELVIAAWCEAFGMNPPALS